MFRAFFGFFRKFGPWVLLAAILFVVAVVLTLLGLVFGFHLGDVDGWLDAHGGWFNAVGNLLFRLFCGAVLLGCVLILFGAIFGRRSPGIGPAEARRDLIAPEPRLAALEAGEDAPVVEPPAPPPALGCVLLAIPLGYFAWIGMTMR